MKQKMMIPIKNKIINKNNLLDIADYIYSLAKNGKSNFLIKFKNNMEISSNDLSCFNSRKIEEYEIEKINLSYNSNDYKKEIDISIYNYDTFGFSSINVCADEEQWIGQVNYKINEFVSFCNNTNSFINFFRKYTIIPIFLILVFSFVSNSFWMTFLNKVTSEYNSVMFWCWYVDFVMIYIWLAAKISKAYPSIEIDICNKTNKSKKRRNVIMGFMTIIILPIVVNIIYDIIKIILK